MSQGTIAELRVMETVASALSELEAEARGRVLNWLLEYFGYREVAEQRAKSSLLGNQPNDPIGDAEPETFSRFGDLYAVVDPKSNEDKALTAAYWWQVVRGEETWQTASLQKTLKELGFAVSNISDAVAGAERKRPQKVIQLRKSGQSRQARKTFKLSQVGIDYIADMISQSSQC